jgi:CHAT domain-containing protein
VEEAQAHMVHESVFSSDRLHQAQMKLKAAHDQLHTVWEDIARSGHTGRQYAEIRRGTSASFAELKPVLAAMPPGTLLVECFFTNTDLLLFTARAGDKRPRCTTLPITSELMERIATHGDPGQLPSDETARTGLHELSEIVVRYTEPGNLVWFVPHTNLHHVPLHAISIGDKPLTARNPLCYTPSASAMLYLRRGTRSLNKRALVVGDAHDEEAPPYAAWEARAVVRRFDGEAELLTGQQVSPEAFRERLAGTRHDVVHLACHGLFDMRDPGQSGLRLGGRTLTIADLSVLPLDASLAVLSACESGRGKRRTGDDLVGLTRALLLAGTRSVMVSLWKADDVSTALHMDAFYAAYADGAAKAEALRHAQETLRRLTVAEAIDRCRANDDSGDHWPVALMVAKLRSLANDHAGARADYAEIAAAAPAGGPLHRRAASRERLMRAWESTSGVPDYDQRPFAAPYQWAAFTLVGES